MTLDPARIGEDAGLGTHRAVVCERYGPFSDMRVRKIARLPLGSGEVRLAVEAVGVSFAAGLMVAGRYQRRPPLPFVPGTEVAGRVLEAGPDVTRLAVGDRVVASVDWGGYAEEVVAVAVNVFPLPAPLDAAAAVALPISYPTAYGGLLWRARVAAGETVLVLGAAGGVGLAAAEIARIAGARPLVAASSPEKRAFLAGRGFTERVAPGEGMAEAVRALAPDGVDVVFDPVGGDAFDAGLRLLADGGRLVTIGYTSGRIPEVAANILLLKNVGVLGFNWSHYIGWGKVDVRHRHADAVAGVMADLVGWWRDGLIAPAVHAVLPLDRFAEAMDLLKTRRSMGRVVLDPSA